MTSTLKYVMLDMDVQSVSVNVCSWLISMGKKSSGLFDSCAF